jgi:anti-sigma factor RsiW
MWCWTQLIGKIRGWLTNTDRLDIPADRPAAMLRCREMVDLIVDYLEDSLEPNIRHAFEAHIADCQNCWRFLQTYRQTIALGQQLRGEAIPPEMRERLETFLQSRFPRDS